MSLNVAPLNVLHFLNVRRRSANRCTPLVRLRRSAGPGGALEATTSALRRVWTTGKLASMSRPVIDENNIFVPNLIHLAIPRVAQMRLRVRHLLKLPGRTLLVTLVLIRVVFSHKLFELFFEPTNMSNIHV